LLPPTQPAYQQLFLGIKKATNGHTTLLLSPPTMDWHNNKAMIVINATPESLAM
jgi:hypothetical protein